MIEKFEIVTNNGHDKISFEGTHSEFIEFAARHGYFQTLESFRGRSRLTKLIGPFIFDSHGIVRYEDAETYTLFGY